MNTFLNISMAEYLADHGRTSGSDLKLVERDPRQYRAKLLGQRQDKPSDAMNLGSYVHALWLEGRAETRGRFAFYPSRANLIVPEMRLGEPGPRGGKPKMKPTGAMVPQDGSEAGKLKRIDRTTTEGKQAHRDFMAASRGLTVVYPEQQPVAEAMLRALEQHPLCRDMKASGFKPEVTAHWEDDETGEPMKARYDGLMASSDCIVELKTVERLDPTSGLVVMGWIRQGWHRKSAIYHDAYRAITGKNATIVWVLVEATADDPRVAVVFDECDSNMAELGRRGNASYGLRGYRDLIREAQSYRETNDYRLPWEREPLGRFELPFGLETAMQFDDSHAVALTGARKVANG